MENLESQKLKLEQQKIEHEYKFKEADLALRRNELQARIDSEERGKTKKGLSPVVTTILVAIFGLLGTGVGAILQGLFNMQLEQKKFESSLLAKALEPDDASQRAERLNFYITIGMIKDPDLIERLGTFLKTPSGLPQVTSSSTSPEVTDIKGLFETCEINTDRQSEVREISLKIEQNKSRYEPVSQAVGVPWEVVGLLHYLESNLEFSTHFHNGDPLTARTVNLPHARPLDGTPPFTWEESAIDALKYNGLSQWLDWSDAGILYQLEKYNGFGYRRHNINSPFLWSYSNHYSKGGYEKDHRWSDTKVYDRPGAAVILKQIRSDNLK